MSVCKREHTAYDPTAEEFKCPGCGAEVGDFYVDNDWVGGNDCEKLHIDDNIVCDKCEIEITPEELVEKILKAKSVKCVKCPTCGGSGVVETPLGDPKTPAWARSAGRAGVGPPDRRV